MIGVEESKALFALLNAETRSLEDIFSEFSSRFSRDVHFRVCCSIAMLLEDKRMLKTSQRLVSFGILHQTYSSQPPSSNPFISLLIDAACDDSSEKVELAFIQRILGFVTTSNNKEILKKQGTYLEARILMYCMQISFEVQKLMIQHPLRNTRLLRLLSPSCSPDDVRP